jgi:hypothetical protein
VPKELHAKIADVKLEITDIKGGLTAYNTRLDEVGVVDQQRDTWVATLEEAAQSLDRTFNT